MISRLRAAVLLAAFLAFAPVRLFANACQSAVTSGNWATAGSWVGCGGVAPTAADSVTILNGHTITINTSPTVSSITVNNGGTLAADASNRTITLNTTAAVPMTLVGTGVFTPNNSTVVISGNAALTLTSGAITFNNLSLTPTITVARAYTFGAGAITVNGNFTINPTAASALALTVNMGAPITVTGTTTITRTTSATSQLTTTASNHALKSGLISIAAGGTLTANNSTIELTGTAGTLFTNAGTFTAGGSSVFFTPNASVTLTSNNAFTFNNLSLTPTLTADRVYTFGTSALQVNGQFNIDPSGSANRLTATLGAATTVTGAVTVQAEGASATSTLGTGTNFALTASSLTITSDGTVQANASTLTLTTTAAVPITNNGTFTGGTSTVIINGNAGLTLTSGAINFYNLTLSPTITLARAYTFGSGAVNIGNNFTINPTAASALALTVTMGSNMAVTGTTSITRTSLATSSLNTSGSSYSLTSGLINIAAGGTLTANASTITLNGTAGTLFTNAGTFTAGTSLVKFTPDATVTLTSNNAFTFNDVELSPTISLARAYTFGTTALTVGGDLLINPTAGSALALTVNMGAATTVTGTVTVTRTTSATANLTTTASNFALNAGNIDVEAGGTLTANASSIVLNGTSGTLFTNAGTFTPGTSIVHFKPDATVTLTSNNAFTFNNLTIAPTLTADRAYTFGTGTLQINGALTMIPQGSANILTTNLGGATTITGAATISSAGSANSRFDTTGSDYDVTCSSLTIGAGDTVNANGSTFTLTTAAATPLTNSGTFTPGTSTVVITGNAALTLTSGTLSLYNLTLSPTITTGRAYTMGAGLTTIANDFTINPTAASALALTVNMAAGLTVGGTTTITRTTSATAALTTTGSNFGLTSGNIDIEAGGTLTANAASIVLNGTSGTLFTNAGTFTQGTSTVHFKPDATVTLTSNNAFTFNNLTLAPTLSADRAYTFGANALAVAGAFTILPTGSANTLTVNLGAATTVTGATTVSSAGSAASELDTTPSSWAVTTSSLTIASGDAVTANGSTFTLTTAAAVPLTNNGTFTPGSSTIVINGNAALTLTSGTLSLYNLTLSPTITVARAYTMGAGLTSIANDFTINPTAASALALTVNMAAGLTVGGTTLVTRTTSATSSLSTTGSNFLLQTGDLNIATGGTVTANAATIRLNGTTGPLLTRVGTFTQGTSIVEITAPASVAINSGTVTFSTLTINSLGQSFTLGAAVTVTSLTLAAGELDDAGNQITGNAGGVLSAASGTTLRLGSGTATTFPTLFTAANTRLSAGSLVVYDATVAQSISGTPTYADLRLSAPSGTPTKTLLAALHVMGDLTIDASNTLSTSGSNFSMTLRGDYTNNGTLTVNTASVTFGNSGAIALSGNMTGTSAFNAVLMNGGGTVTPSSSVLINGALTVTAGTLAGTANITVTGAVTGNGTTGTINLTGGTFEQQVSAAQTFGTNVAGANNWTFNNLSFTNASAANRIITVNPTGTGQIIVNGALTVGNAANSNTTTLDNNTNDRTIDVNGDMVITSKGVYSASSVAALTVGGDWSNSGTFTNNNSTVTFDGGAVTHAIAGTSSFYVLRSVVSGGTLQFASGTTTTVTNTLALQDVSLVSSSPGVQWNITFSGTSQTITTVAVQDSNAGGGSELVVTGGTDNGNNVNWDFDAPGAISTLVLTSTTGATMRIAWTTVGDDDLTGSITGGAVTIQYTTDTVFSSWSPTAGQPAYVFRVTIPQTAVAPGTASTAFISGLTGGATYFVRMWTNDSSNRFSAISNSAQTPIAIPNVNLLLSQTTISFGSLNAGSTNVITSSITITNTGNTNQTYRISITNPSVWTATSGAPGTDQFRLTAVIRSSLPASGDFSAANDVVTTSPADSSDTALARDGDAQSEKGVNVLPGETRGLWFRVEMPPTSSTTTAQTINLSALAL